ncbi:MAG: hypothetical protein ABJP48_05965 [Erythrobacter sp.]
MQLATAGLALFAAQPLLAQDDPSATNDAATAGATSEGDPQAENSAEAESQQDGAYENETREPGPAREHINLSITVPRGDVNQAQAQACQDRADAATLTGEIVVCRQLGQNPDNLFSGSREAAQRRYAEETQNAGRPQAPEAFGIANHGNAISLGGVPPPALIIDVEALPEAPAGSDADRVARGLRPLDRELTEEEERERRQALGLEAPE